MILLKFGTDIPGDATTKGFEKQINIDSVSWGVGRGISTVASGNSRETSKASFSEISLSKATDIASAELFIQACVGKTLISATLTWINSGGTDNTNQVYQVVTLSHPIVSSYSQSSGGDRPSESFSLNFDKITFSYTGWDGGKNTGTSAKTYNLATGEAGGK